MRLTARDWVALGALAVCGAALLLYATQIYGIGVSVDSIYYISAAQNIMLGKGAVSAWGVPLVGLAPLYSVFLGAVGYVVRLDPLLLARYLNALLFGLTVYVGGRIAFQFLKHSGWALLATIAILFSRALLYADIFALSEPLFIFLIVLAIFFIKQYLDAQQSSRAEGSSISTIPDRDALSLSLTIRNDWRWIWQQFWNTRNTGWLIAAAVAIGLACLTRYIGIIFVAWGLMLILFLNSAPRNTKIIHSVLFLGITLLPLGLWLVRNYFVSNTFVGGRYTSIFTLEQNVGFTFDTILFWFLPQAILTRGWVLLLVGLGIGAIVPFAIAKDSTRWKQFLRDMTPLLLFLVLYLGLLLYSATATAIDKIGNRFLAPVFVPLIIVLIGLVQTCAASYAQRFPRAVWVAGALVLALLLSHPIRDTVFYAMRIHNDGEQYGSRVWQTSPTTAYLRSQPLPSDCRIETNTPEGIYILANILARHGPIKGRYNSPELVNASVEQLRGKWIEPGDRVCLIWFNSFAERSFTTDELKAIANFETLGAFADGAVYMVTPK
jgi:hypothetical protein